MENGKEHMLDMLMHEVKDCDLCCRDGGSIKPDKILKNFIAERPDSPRYGGCPNLWTDWANRLESKIAVVGQDWGCEEGKVGINHLRQQYEDLVNDSGNHEEIWRLKRIPLVEDKATPKMIKFFKISSALEGLPGLPGNFSDELFLTNAILCVRRGPIYSGSGNIDPKMSSMNCQTFLRRQLYIVRPIVVITFGRYALSSLGQIKESQTLLFRIKEIHSASPGYIKTYIKGVPMSIVPVFHPSWPQNRNNEQQVEDYRYLWRALSDTTQLFGKELIKFCFPNVENH